jgi:large subunit ribosomal protein LP1
MSVCTDLSALTGGKKQEMIASLACLILGDDSADITSEALTAIAEASGNKMEPMWATLFANAATAAGGIEKFTMAPGSGGGGGGGGDAAPAAAVVEVVEEEEMDLSAGASMFGDDDEATGDY